MHNIDRYAYMSDHNSITTDEPTKSVSRALTDCICGKQETKVNSARSHRREPASRDLWRQTAISSHPG